MMSVMVILLSLVSNMTIRMLRSRLEHLNILIGLPKLSLTTGATIAKNASIINSYMNLISLNTSLEDGLSSSASKSRKVKHGMKVIIP